MPTIANMCNKLVSRLAMIPFVVLVYDLSTSTMWQLNRLSDKPTRDTSFTIVLDQLNQDSPVNYPDTYYCNTLDELKQVITFVQENYDMYLDNIENNEYDNLLPSDVAIKTIEYSDNRILE